MRKKWSIRAYEKGEEYEIFELMKATYPEREYEYGKWLEWWNWKYWNNPFGTSRIWVADHDSKIVGMRSVILQNMKIADEIVVGSQNTDLMTHPDYRRQGIFSAVEKKSFSQLKDEEICITYSFPSKMSYPGYVKSGFFFDICDLQTPIMPLNLKNLIEKRVKNGFMSNICSILGTTFISAFYRVKEPPKINDLTFSQVKSFDDRINDFWIETAKDHKIITVRDKKYLNWRYVNVPDVNYTIYLAEKDGEITGYVVLRCVETQGLILGCIFDIMTLPDHDNVNYCLISKAIEYFEKERVDIIYCKMVVNKQLRRFFRKSGFIYPIFLFKNKFIVRINSQKISKAYLTDPKNWFVQLGDSDFV